MLSPGRHRRERQQGDGFRLTRTFEIRSSRVAAIAAVAERSSTLLAGGVPLAASGAKLGNLRGVDVGVSQVAAPNSTQVSDYGEYDTSTLRKDVTAVVNVTFALGR